MYRQRLKINLNTHEQGVKQITYVRHTPRKLTTAGSRKRYAQRPRETVRKKTAN